MSRLFEALKGARSFRQGTEGQPDESVWDALGINGSEIPPKMEAAALSQPSARTELLAEEIAAVVPEEDFVERDEMVEYASTLPAEMDANPTEVALDPRARLLPHAADTVIAEYYRKLRTKIIQQQTEKPFRSLLVTSASPQEGKTVTVLNLGLSLAMLPSFRVLVVDGDMRRGTLGKWLGVDENQPGLSNLIDGSARLEEVLLKSDKIPMHFLLRGNSQVHDLHSSQLDVHLREAAAEYDLVLVDSPPVNLISDVQLLAASCDAVLLVARAYTTPRKALEKAVQDLARFRIIGTVLNAGRAGRYRYREDYY